MKKKKFKFESLLLFLSLIIGFFFILVGIGMEEFYEISGNSLML